MSRSFFGWSLPPGCTHRMIEDQCSEGPCEVCGNHIDACICPECGVCGSVGDPKCYGFTAHGLERTPEQIESRRVADEAIERENKFWEDYAKSMPDYE